MGTVSFVHMEDGTQADYVMLEKMEEEYAAGLADRVLDHLRSLKDEPSGYQIDRYDHSLQTATRALRDGADEETVVAALLHDIGDALSPYNHSEFAAAILRPYVSERTYFIVKHHGLFQAFYYAHHLGMDRNARDRHKDHKYYKAAVDFCHLWDQTAFDPDYETLPIETFEPMVRRIFSRPPFQHDRT